MVSKADQDILRKLKAAEPFGGYRECTAEGEECKVEILGRGEVAFFQLGERALFVEILAGRGVVFASSIRRWDDLKKVTDEERETVVEIMVRAMEHMGAKQVEVVRS